MTDSLPQFVSFGEALTDMIRDGGDHWLAKPGGAPWNVARVMASLGVPSAFGGAISHDVFGDTLWLASQQAGLDMRFIQRVKASPLLAMVYQLSPPRYFFIGDDSADLHFDVAQLPASWADQVHWAMFGGISLAREPLASHLLQLASQLKAQGVRIAYDPNFRAAMDERYDPTLRKMVELADVIKVSDEDLAGLFRTQDLSTALATIRSWHPDALFFYTQGAEGATLYAQQSSWQARPPEIEVIDTVGAGDASIGGLIHSLMQHPAADMPTHLRYAMGAGAGACMAAGATPPTIQQIQQLAARVVVKSGG
ncbi:fructokinase [Chitinivorax tropicus]|uniref:Fructokinase n=1 Tax=Chitinivorax tropicus TaxID=714531 RepID=A0A840MPP1_9PROT|nr:carbohydrate kinase [Chitinivorax tropicus]MBB5018997.1 fructokinase [Chitinivorax tropicus]